MLYIIVGAILSYDWQHSRYAYTSITTNMGVVSYDVMMAVPSLGDWHFSALL